ncbi:GntR family transcriptional regulator [Ornithinibacillus contaminans]|uniref:GntR family transcriptional regulator n=1 Tax=Ornithinibacillus contaminans TaxID=694055 RepID=UPI00064DC67B|nr:GntR family transcriptional regulator [Ornithinibacillus contaminans]
MKNSLDENKPIFLQIKEQLEDSIINDSIKAGERVPSTNEFASFYKINPATAAKGINELVAEEILIKRRGIGMFVTDNAKEILIAKRRKTFFEHYILPLKEEAKKLQITEEELLKMMAKGESMDEN